MVRRCQAICHGDAENFERRGSDNSWQQRRRNNLTLPFPVDENDLIRFLPVERQVVGPCPRLYVVYFGGPRVDVAGRDDKVGGPSNGVNHSIQLSRIVNWTPQVQKLCVHWTLTSFISASSCYFVCVRGRTVFHFSASKPQIWGSGTPGRCLTEPLLTTFVLGIV